MSISRLNSVCTWIESLIENEWLVKLSAKAPATSHKWPSSRSYKSYKMSKVKSFWSWVIEKVIFISFKGKNDERKMTTLQQCR